MRTASYGNGGKAVPIEYLKCSSANQVVGVRAIPDSEKQLLISGVFCHYKLRYSICCLNATSQKTLKKELDQL